MKKLQLLKTVLLLCALIVGSGNLWAATYTLLLSSEKKISSSGLTDGTVVWSITNNSASIGNNFQTSYSGEQFGTGDTQGNIVLSTSSIAGTITSVVVTSQTGTDGGATVAVSVGGTSWGSKAMKVATATSGSDPGDLKFTGSNSGTVQITLTQTVKKAMYLNKITITYTPIVETKVATPKISLDEGLYYGTKNVTITTTTPDADIYYTTDGTTPTSSSTKYTGAISVSSTQTIKAIGIKDGLMNSELVSAAYTIITAVPARNPKNYNTNYFVKVTRFDDLEDGDAVLIVNLEGTYVMGDQSSSIRSAVSVSSYNGVISALPANAVKIVVIKVGNRLFFSTGATEYLYATSSSSNNIGTDDEATAGANALASIEIAASGDASIEFLGDNSRNNLRYNYNSGSPRFSCYASTSEMPVVHLYKEVAVAGPSNPVDNGDNTITITTSANMDGWRAFYHETQDYEVDVNTTIYTIQAKSATSGEVTLTALAATKIPAGQPVILKTTDAGHSMTLSETTGAAALGTNLLAVTDGTNNVDGYRLGYGDVGGSDAVGFFKFTTTIAPAAGIVYIAAGNVNTGAGAHGLGINFDETTGIADVRGKMSDVRGDFYNLAGQRVAQPTKGLYIVNGKKIIMK